MKNIKLASNILKLGGAMLFASSFFVEDRSDAIKRRYLSVGLFATGLLIDYTLYIPKLRAKKVKTNIKK